MSSEVECQDAWLSIGAGEKAKSVEQLAGDLGIESVLEVGCGTGAVLAELIQIGIGSTYAACEPSPELCAHARARRYEADVDVRCETFDASGFERDRWDLIVLSHVLEHTEDPSALMAQILAAARFVIVEVPIEGTRMGALRSWLRHVVTGRPRTDNAAGHVQFFSVADVPRLVHWAGGRVLRTRAYFPSATYRHMANEAVGWRRAYYRAWILAHRLLGPRLLTELYYGHLAVLAGPRRFDGQRDPHPLFWHGRTP
jgi:SAM-dependent methyltransferase